MMRQSRLKLAKALQREPEILMSLRILGIDRKRLVVLNNRLRDFSAGAKNIGQVKTGARMRRVESDRLFQMLAGAVEVIDPDEGRPEHGMLVDRLAGHLDRFRDQVARLIEGPKLAAHRRQSAQGAEMIRLIGEKLPIGLFGGMQSIAASNRSCRLNPRPGGETGFIHERAIFSKALRVGRMDQL